jgi:hypothetical protein
LVAVLLSKKRVNGQVITIAYLADFGVGKLSSHALTSGAAVNGSCIAGTPHYMAPVSAYAALAAPLSFPPS